MAGCPRGLRGRSSQRGLQRPLRQVSLRSPLKGQSHEDSTFFLPPLGRRLEWNSVERRPMTREKSLSSLY